MPPRVLAASLAVTLLASGAGCGAGGDREEIAVDMLDPDRARATFVAPHSAVEDTRATLVRTADGWRIERLEN